MRILRIRSAYRQHFQSHFKSCSFSENRLPFSFYTIGSKLPWPPWWNFMTTSQPISWHREAVFWKNTCQECPWLWKRNHIWVSQLWRERYRNQISRNLRKSSSSSILMQMKRMPALKSKTTRAIRKKVKTTKIQRALRVNFFCSAKIKLTMLDATTHRCQCPARV